MVEINGIDSIKIITNTLPTNIFLFILVSHPFPVLVFLQYCVEFLEKRKQARTGTIPASPLWFEKMHVTY